MRTVNSLRMLTGLAIFAVAGCGKSPEVSTTSSTDADATTLASNDKGDAKYNVPFTSAVTDEVGAESLIPPDTTVAGKPTAPLRAAVERLWPTISLTDANGKATTPIAILETDEGEIEIALRPDIAPNHTRNFMALIQAGYYDGLRFDRLVHQEAVSSDGTKHRIDMVRAGCPTGTGDPGVGHIGYFLRPEFDPSVKHEEGTVGFTRDAHSDTAGVRFYICLGTAPLLDGHFTVVGKVTKGIDTVKRIAGGKTLPIENDPTGEMPEKPSIIKKAQIRGLASGTPVAHNKP
jgi:peptidyl-prolyl cis-trans isomerase B (cyclophilin B)